MPYRDEVEALRARLRVVEAERDQARAALAEVEHALEEAERRALRARTTVEMDSRWCSIPGGDPTQLLLVNDGPRKVEVFRIGFDGRSWRAGTVVPGGRFRTRTHVGTCFRIADAHTGETLDHVRVEPGRLGKSFVVHPREERVRAGSRALRSRTR